MEQQLVQLLSAAQPKCVCEAVLYALFVFLILQASLNKLMETLGQSEPYFVKCIRSNADKVLFAPSILTFTLKLVLFLFL